MRKRLNLRPSQDKSFNSNMKKQGSPISITIICIAIVYLGSFAFIEDESRHVGRELLGTRENPITHTNISDQFCAMDSNGQTHCLAYAEVVAYYAGTPGIILTALSLISLLVYLLFHFVFCFCCNGCANRCLPPPVGSKAKLWLVRLVPLLAVLGLAACMAAAFVSNKTVNGSVNTMETTIVNTTTSMNNTLNTVVGLLEQFNVTKDISSVASSAQSYLNQASGQSSSATTQVNKYNDIRSKVFIALFVFPLALAVFGCLGALIRLRVVVWIIGLLCFFASAFMWASLGIHSSVEYAFNDLCKDILQLGETRYGSNQGISAIIQCANGTNAFDPVIAYINNGTNQVYNDTCTEIHKLCSSEYVDCHVTTCNRTTINSYANATISEPTKLACRLDPTRSCPFNSAYAVACKNQPDQIYGCEFSNHTVAECQTKCNSSSLRDASQQIVAAIGIIDQLNDILYNKLLPILNCEIIEEAFLSLKTSLCTDLKGSVHNISTISIIAGVVIALLTITSLLGCVILRKAEDVEGMSEYEMK
ncbi:hypothetical protein PROFUN_07941 [Planoprotostelium fungivorum]|uniref:Uncharacterized protein n=1 Tax=Planoprotostelium fungivorum TaxID=1890364 RepID=A0A2P6NL45_9EUKA|nr:hypothetical protein PROFUN_07941 [Planoprotostelium fungivorum]